MSLSEKLKRFHAIKKQIKELEKEAEEISASTIDNIPDEWMVIDWVKFSRVTKRVPVLIEWANVEEIQTKFPTAVTFKVDIKELEKIPEAHEYLWLKESSYILSK